MSGIIAIPTPPAPRGLPEGWRMGWPPALQAWGHRYPVSGWGPGPRSGDPVLVVMDRWGRGHAWALTREHDAVTVSAGIPVEVMPALVRAWEEQARG